MFFKLLLAGPICVSVITVPAFIVKKMLNVFLLPCLAVLKLSKGNLSYFLNVTIQLALIFLLYTVYDDGAEVVKFKEYFQLKNGRHSETFQYGQYVAATD